LPSYAENAAFIPGVHWLAHNFASMRKVRGDGNCFYRALLFSYLEELLSLLQSSSEEVLEEGLREHQR
jgi:hypothetical protein